MHNQRFTRSLRARSVPTLLDEIIGDEGADEHEFPAIFTRDISASVGAGGANRKEDVESVQFLLNTFIAARRLSGISPLTQDGDAGPKTIAAIRKFQQTFLGMNQPDGRVDPGGSTLEKLNGSVFQAAASTSSPPPSAGGSGGSSGSSQAGPTSVPYFTGFREPVWPVQTTHTKRFNVTLQDVNRASRSRGFGAYRQNGRRHAGIDLYAHHRDIVRAVGDGVVVGYQSFHRGTYALLIEGEGGVVLYGEIEKGSPRSLGIGMDSRVKAGQPIARVGCMKKEGGKCTSHMLHFETYRVGTRKNHRWYVRKGSPAELLDPTDLLQRAAERARLREDSAELASGVQGTRMVLDELVGEIGAEAVSRPGNWRDPAVSILGPVQYRRNTAGMRNQRFTESLRARSVPTLLDELIDDGGAGEHEFPAFLTRDISSSVGAGGTNREEDVESVQFLLNTFIAAGRLPGISPLTQDGDAGPKTIAAIMKFQQTFVGMNQPDGRVDPGGVTLERLNGSVFQAAASTPSPPPSAGGSGGSSSTSPTVGSAKSVAAVRELAAEAGLPAAWGDFFALVAWGESRGNPKAKLESRGEAAAAARSYGRNRRRYDGCGYPPSAYSWGSGGWFAFLPAVGLAQLGMDARCRPPSSVFEPRVALAMAVGFAHGLMKWKRYARVPTWLNLRAMWGWPSKGGDEAYLGKKRPKFDKHANAVGLSASWLDGTPPPLEMTAAEVLARLGG